MIKIQSTLTSPIDTSYAQAHTHTFNRSHKNVCNKIRWNERNFIAPKRDITVFVITGCMLISLGKWNADEKIPSTLHTLHSKRAMKCIAQSNLRCDFIYRKSFSVKFMLTMEQTWGEISGCGLFKWIKMRSAINGMTCKNIYCRESEKRLLRWQFDRWFFFLWWIW